ncbi:hypothetical protein CDEST_06903 [Colletotrichum destructivum]|uniref:Uncharacterized protein n=1 Tax=Colletotrichum destructivum TaxID=34406 RepID=A0AAX4IEV9_9PEZI|nr:hypothetical protein CDEST_06903 [Colletotrichum destructivum]
MQKRAQCQSTCEPELGEPVSRVLKPLRRTIFSDTHTRQYTQHTNRIKASRLKIRIKATGQETSLFLPCWLRWPCTASATRSTAPMGTWPATEKSKSSEAVPPLPSVRMAGWLDAARFGSVSRYGS